MSWAQVRQSAGKGARLVVAPRVLVDATAVPADRGALGRYVDGLVSALGAAGPIWPWPASEPTRSATAALCPAPRRRRARRDLPPGRPAGLGAERPAAGGPAGRRRRHPLAALLDAAAARPADRGDHPRPDVLHRARRAQPGRGDVLQGRDPHLGPPRHPADRAVQGHQGRAGPGLGADPPASTSPTTASTTAVPPAHPDPAAARPHRLGCTTARTSPTWARWSRARTSRR